MFFLEHFSVTMEMDITHPHCLIPVASLAAISENKLSVENEIIMNLIGWFLKCIC